MGNNIYSKSDENEFFPTQQKIRDDLYNELDLFDFKTILDPCCGDGGLEVFNSKYEYRLFDIEDRGIGAEICDFLKRTPEKKYDCAVINPPFGLTVEFVRKAKEWTDHIFLIAPIRTTLKNFGEAVRWASLDIDYPFKGFGILTSIGIFHLDFNYRKFGTPPGAPYKIFLGEKLPKEKTWENHFIETDKAPDKYFIVDRLTKARVLRGEQLIKDSDLYNPNDESAFVVDRGNTNVKSGDKTKRWILTFDTFEQMKKWQNDYNARDLEVRQYMYLWGNTLLRMDEKPW